MKFRFNGDSDCPDWIIAQIYSLSRLSSVKVKQLGQIVIEGIIQPPLNEAKVEKLFADSKLELDFDLKSSVACLHYLISRATQFACDSTAFQSELQQLGLPREHSSAIKRIFDESESALSKHFKANSLKINNLTKVSWSGDQNNGLVTLKLNVGNEICSATLTPHMVDSLLSDLEDLQRNVVELQKDS